MIWDGLNHSRIGPSIPCHKDIPALLTAINLSIFRGERLVLSNVNFALRTGGILVLRGANGAGKSSLLRALAGLTPLAAGELRWGEENALEDLPACYTFVSIANGRMETLRWAQAENAPGHPVKATSAECR